MIDFDFYTCSKCGRGLSGSNAACEACGVAGVTRNIVVSDTVGIDLADSIGLKVGPKKKSAPGSKPRWQRELKQVREPWMKTDRLVDKTLDTDRTMNTISEKCVDVATGEVMLDKSGALDEHTGHGSAKPRSEQ